MNKRFLVDENGPTQGLELDCLKQPVGLTTILEEVPSHLCRDILVFEAFDIIAGPLNATLTKGVKWEIPEYPKVKKTFDLVEKMERKKDYERIYHDVPK